MTLASVVTFKEKKSDIKSALKKSKSWTINQDRFGVEKEYTGAMLRAGVGSIVVDLDALVRSEMQFVKCTTAQERQQLNAMLDVLTTSMAAEDGGEIAASIDDVKIFLRNLNIRNSEDRYHTFIGGIDELQLKSTKLSLIIEEQKEELSNLQGHQEIVKTQITTLETYKADIENTLHKLDQDLSDLSTKLVELESTKDIIEQTKNETDEVLLSIKNDESVVASFVKKISIREMQLEDQESKTETYLKKLDQHTIQQKDFLDQANNLIAESRSALGYTTSAGLSAAFNERYTELKSGKAGAGWILGAGTFLIVAIAIGLWIANGSSLDLYMIVARLSLIPLCIAGSWFCASQFVKLKNIAEDYAYKAAISKSIAGLSAQISGTPESGETQFQYLAMALREIHKDPLRSRDTKSEKASTSIPAAFLKAIDDTLESKLDKLKVLVGNPASKAKIQD